MMAMVGLASNYDAEVIYKQVLDNQRVELGDSHPDTKFTMNVYSMMLANPNRPKNV